MYRHGDVSSLDRPLTEESYMLQGLNQPCPQLPPIMHLLLGQVGHRVALPHELRHRLRPICCRVELSLKAARRALIDSFKGVFNWRLRQMCLELVRRVGVERRYFIPGLLRDILRRADQRHSPFYSTEAGA